MSADSAPRPIDRVIIAEHIDPNLVGTGGIDGIINDFIEASTPEIEVSLVGITGDLSEQAGVWTSRGHGLNQFEFLAVRHLDKTTRRRLPHSVLFAASLMRHRSLLPGCRYQVHRAETGLVARLLGLEYSLFLHNDLSGLTGPNSDSFWRHFPRLYRWLERMAVNGAESVAIFSARGAQRISSYRQDVEAVRTWFDPNVFYPRLPTNPASELRVLWVGRMEAQKDPILAIEAFARVADERAARMTMVGSGALLDNAVKRAAELAIQHLVTFAGPLPKTHVAELMRESDVFLLTSHYEGSPTVLVEAAASGLPTAATREADSDNFLQDGTCGVLASSRSGEDVARAICSSLELTHLGDRIAARVESRSLQHGMERFKRVALRPRRNENGQ